MNIALLLQMAAEACPDRTAITFEGEHYDYQTLFDAASRRAVEQASRGALRMRWEGRAALSALQKWAVYRAPRRMPPANTVDALSLVRTMRVLIGLWKQWRADAVEYHREVIAATLRARRSSTSSPRT